MQRSILFCTAMLIIPAAGRAVAGEPAVQELPWMAGVASVSITPEESMWMAGYAARTKPSEGKVHDLHAKALALQDRAGKQVVIVTTDLIGIPRELRESLSLRLAIDYGLSSEALLLNASHTHCGPELRASKTAVYGLSAERAEQSREYFEKLKGGIAAAVGRALSEVAPAKLSYHHARAGFAMNRRLPTSDGFRNSPNPEGPVDHEVPVLRVEGADGALRAVLFGYACHNTTLSFYEFSGDYAGFAQQYLEETHPGTTALFMTGCGADQNPYPRGKLELAQQHGRSLANAVMAALDARPRSVDGPLSTVLEEVTLDFATPPGHEELLAQRESSNKYVRRHAELLLNELSENGTIRTTYPYPVQVVQFGDDLTLVALAGEVVVDYSLRLKRELAGGSAVWIAGYSNDVFGYVPSVRVLHEGGYEGGGAMLYTALPGPFAPTVEERIVRKVRALVQRANPTSTDRPH